MQKFALITVGIFIGLLSSFTYSIFIDDSFGVIVANETEMKISRFTVSIRDREFSVIDIGKGTDKIIRVPIKGEGAYTVRAQLENGKLLNGNGGYVESGYLIYEFVRENEIEHRIRSY